MNWRPANVIFHSEYMLPSIDIFTARTDHALTPIFVCGHQIRGPRRNHDAVDHICYFARVVVTGVGEFLHAWRIHPHSVGGRPGDPGHQSSVRPKNCSLASCWTGGNSLRRFTWRLNLSRRESLEGCNAGNGAAVHSKDYRIRSG